MNLDGDLSVRKIQKIPDRATGFLVTAPSLVAPNEEFEVNIAAIRIDGYPDTDFEGKVKIESTDEEIENSFTFQAKDQGMCRLADVNIGRPGMHIIKVEMEGSKLRGLGNPVKCSEERALGCLEINMLVLLFCLGRAL